MTIVIYSLFAVAVGLGRLVEMSISRRRQRALIARGMVKVAQPHFGWMVLLHGGVLTAAPVEVVVLVRPFIPALAVPMIVLFILSNMLRWWVIHTMAGHWNVQVMDSLTDGVVTGGPFRWIRHPNYLAVFVELLTVPLIHTAWLTALIGTIMHVSVLRRRIAVEEAVLLKNAAYCTAMGNKSRFLPGLF